VGDVHRLRRLLVTLVAGILLVLVSAGACDGTTGPGTEPQPGSTVAPDDDGPDDPGDDSSGPGDDSEGPGDAGPSDDADEAEGADDGGVSGRGDSSDN
jgi:hypothetical protein